jgi:hypothetical protein
MVVGGGVVGILDWYGTLDSGMTCWGTLRRQLFRPGWVLLYPRLTCLPLNLPLRLAGPPGEAPDPPGYGAAPDVRKYQDSDCWHGNGQEAGLSLQSATGLPWLPSVLAVWPLVHLRGFCLGLRL